MEGAGSQNLEGEGELWSKTASTQCAEMCMCTREVDQPLSGLWPAGWGVAGAVNHGWWPI